MRRSSPSNHPGDVPTPATDSADEQAEATTTLAIDVPSQCPQANPGYAGAAMG